MKQILKFSIILSLLAFYSCENTRNDVNKKFAINSDTEAAEYAMVIHGGAGTILKKNMTTQMYDAYYTALDTALMIGEKILKEGGTSLEAIEKTIHFMEDSPLFNSGRGAVFTNAATNELDASVMLGDNRNAGAIGGVTNVKHPISGAIAVMEKSDHVMMVGKGAEEFCEMHGLEIVDPSYFWTERRWKSLERILEKEKDTGFLDKNPDYKYGTVGAVALDKNGDIAAGTSTGGMTNKKYNRIGDSPIIGAGTFADNKTCGISCTGHGEYFIRYAVAHDVAARMEYKGESVNEAAEYVVNKKLVEAEGSGGLIALDAKGNISMPFNTEGMYRGYIKPGEKVIEMYKNKK